MSTPGRWQGTGAGSWLSGQGGRCGQWGCCDSLTHYRDLIRGRDSLRRRAAIEAVVKAGSCDVELARNRFTNQEDSPSPAPGCCIEGLRRP